MSKPVSDILLIQKYLAGELDARAMHNLERRALDDPFLADAIEGYAKAGEQQKNLSDISARLQGRVERKARVLALPVRLAVAASLLVIIGIGAWLVIRSQNAKPDELKQVAANIRPALKPEQPTVSAPVQATPSVADTTVKEKALASTRFTPPAVASSQADAEAASHPPVLADIQIKPDSDVNVAAASAAAPVSQYNSANADKAVGKTVTPQFKSNPGVNDALVQSLTANKSAAKKYKIMVPETLLSARAANLDVKPALRSGNNSTLIGYVTGNNQPLAGAIVKMAGANFGVVTDARGRFELHNVPDNKGLVVKSLGFATKQLKVNGGDSINVSLEPSVNVLAEVAVSKPSPNNNDDRSSGNTGVHPSAGWKALNDYLDKNASTANGRTGKVILSFTVDGRGSISGFKITQSLSNAADQKAMDLISNGPAWAGNIDGQPHEVTVTVSFH